MAGKHTFEDDEENGGMSFANGGRMRAVAGRKGLERAVESESTERKWRRWSEKELGVFIDKGETAVV